MRRIAWVAFAAVLVAVGLRLAALEIGVRSVTAREQAQRARSDSLARELATSRSQTDAALKEQRRLGRIADSMSRRAVPIRAETDSAMAAIAVKPIVPDSATADTTAMVAVRRAGVDDHAFAVPKFLVDQRDRFASSIRTLDSAWRTEVAARLYADSVTIPALQAQAGTAMALAESRADEISTKETRINRLERQAWIWKVVGTVVAIAGAAVAILH